MPKSDNPQTVDAQALLGSLEELKFWATKETGVQPTAKKDLEIAIKLSQRENDAEQTIRKLAGSRIAILELCIQAALVIKRGNRTANESDIIAQFHLIHEWAAQLPPPRDKRSLGVFNHKLEFLGDLLSSKEFTMNNTTAGIGSITTTDRFENRPLSDQVFIDDALMLRENDGPDGDLAR